MVYWNAVISVCGHDGWLHNASQQIKKVALILSFVLLFFTFRAETFCFQNTYNGI